jgi:aminopeptidase
MMSQLSAIRSLLTSQQLDAVLISSRQNKFCHTGLLSSSGYVLITARSQHIIVDFRYYAELAAKASDYQLHCSDAAHSPWQIINQILAAEGLQRLGFEGNHLSYDESQHIASQLAGSLQSTNLDGLRQIKTPQEIAIIKQACRIADNACEHIRQFIQPGMTEQQVAAELEWFMRQQGAEKPSFDTIVASGVRGAMPHAKASGKVINAGELVTLDFGAQYQGYCSDMTRTFLVAAAVETPHPLYEIYQTVLQAQLTAIAAIRPGVPCKVVDAAARDVIKASGYGEQFGHNTGHAIGIDVHENPRFSPGDTTLLQPGMLLTVEPGIYLPNLGGVRIEDVVLVTGSGCEVLYQMPKTWLTTGGDAICEY